MKKFLLLISLLFINFLQGQVLNAYAKITSVTGNSVLALSNVDQTGHTFTVGGEVIVMQMQDNVIGSNTTNVSTFGDLSTIANAGRYEIRTIAARTPTSGTPTSVTLTSVLSNTFNTGANSAVQLISFRDLGANYTTSANITCLDWNGNVGGVIALSVTNTLTLQHRIIADNNGFRLGRRSNDNGGSVCVAANSTNYIENNRNVGEKGEGIYLSTNNNFDDARGHIINGGGGGGDHNAGGAGGGNYSAGGNGGVGYNNCTTFPGGGIGGAALSAHISASRVFMGGGGGGGQQNNGNATNGGDGGGIILIKANTLASNSTCTSSLQISANGQTASNTGGNDGGGGGGAGGSIVFQVNTFSITATCPLIVRANGGNGGNCTDASAHAGGGGGGQGVIIYSSAQPTLNLTTQVNNGAAGADNSGGSTTAGAGGGSSGTGTIAAASGPLPIKLISFDGIALENSVRLQWQTASEKNNNMFVVERSLNGIDFEKVGSVKGAGNHESVKNYELIDNSPNFGINYYRLTQVDYDGTSESTPLILVNYADLSDIKIYPNPVNSTETLLVDLGRVEQVVEFFIYDLTGHLVYSQLLNVDSTEPIVLNNLQLEKGIYQVKLKMGESGFKTQRLIIN